MSIVSSGNLNDVLASQLNDFVSKFGETSKTSTVSSGTPKNGIGSFKQALEEQAASRDSQLVGGIIMQTVRKTGETLQALQQPK